MKNFIKSILAGSIIGIAGQIYINNTNYFGMIVFAVALIVICYLNYNLFTGKIGYVKNKNDVIKCLIYIIGNLIGGTLIAIDKQPSNIMALKLETPLLLVFYKAIVCGFLIYVCVDIFKKYKTPIGIIYCIPVFLAFKAEHSIATMYFIIATRTFNLKALIFLLVVLIGNSLGSFIARLGDD